MIKNFQNKCQGKAIRVISDTRVLIETLVEFSEVEKRGNNIRERVMHQYAENIFEMKSHGVFFSSMYWTWIKNPKSSLSLTKDGIVGTPEWCLSQDVKKLLHANTKVRIDAQKTNRSSRLSFLLRV